MDAIRIIQREVARAEAMVGKYLGYYADECVLADINISAINDVSDDFKRCVQLIQDLSDARPTSQVARKMVALVDALAHLVQVPRLRQPLMRMWEIEETISTGGFWFIRHAFVIFMALMGVGFVGEDMNTIQKVVSYSAFLITFASLALTFTHFKNATRAFFIGMPVVLGASVAVSALGSGTLMMTFLMLLSFGVFIKSALERFTEYRQETGTGLAAASNADIYDQMELSEMNLEDIPNPFLYTHDGSYPYAVDDDFNSR